MRKLTLAAGVLAAALLVLGAETPRGNLSQESLKLLVSGVACYPDDLLTQILKASSRPLQLKSLADSSASDEPGSRIRDKLAENHALDPSVKALEPYPEIVRGLTAHPLLTTRLGAAYQIQPDDVWAAIRSVRAEVEKKAA